MRFWKNDLLVAVAVLGALGCLITLLIAEMFGSTHWINRETGVRWSEMSTYWAWALRIEGSIVALVAIGFAANGLGALIGRSRFRLHRDWRWLEYEGRTIVRTAVLALASLAWYAVVQWAAEGNNTDFGLRYHDASYAVLGKTLGLTWVPRAYAYLLVGSQYAATLFVVVGAGLYATLASTMGATREREWSSEDRGGPLQRAQRP